MQRQRKAPYGRYTIWEIKNGIWTPLFSRENKLMVSWGYAAARSLGFGDVAYKIDKMYVEFDNTAPPVSIPSFTRNDNRDYYDALSGTRDYLRLPLDSNPTIQIATGYESYFTAGIDGNQLHFTARTAGTVGINGVAFGVSSTVIGVGLVAAPVEADRSQDVLITRGYFAAADQRQVVSNVQIGVTWNLAFPSAD